MHLAAGNIEHSGTRLILGSSSDMQPRGVKRNCQEGTLGIDLMFNRDGRRAITKNEVLGVMKMWMCVFSRSEVVEKARRAFAR